MPCVPCVRGMPEYIGIEEINPLAAKAYGDCISSIPLNIGNILRTHET